jgi:hypothetical protein
MGLTVTEQVKLSVGLTVDSYYISLNENDIHIQRRQGGHQEFLKAPKFHVEAGFTKWISKAAKDAGNGDIGHAHVTLELDAAPTGNIYELVYNKLKEGLTNYVDA